MDRIIAALGGCCGMARLVLEEGQHPPLLELISDEGEFQEADFNNFLTSVELHKYGGSYAVVAIMGKQTSGKSTLLNQLFGTNFTEMNALDGRRRQVTKGIWLSKAKLEEQLMLVLDLEGTDGRERGEDTNFERQSALFALAVADFLIINMWCKDLGHENAGNRPLLKAIFEAVLTEFASNKTTLIFALRDKTKAPVDILEAQLTEDVEKIWETTIKPEGREDTHLSDIFNVEVTVFSNYEDKPDIFKNEVAQLKPRFLYHERRHGNDASDAIPISDANRVWDQIKVCKSLHLPPLNVMIATVRCEEIAMEKLRLLASDENWLDLQNEARTALVSDFSAKIRVILHIYLSEYDRACILYVEDVRTAKREYLIAEALKVFRTAHMNTLDHLRLTALIYFETRLKNALNDGEEFAESVRTCQNSCERRFNEQCISYDSRFQEDISAVRGQLLCDIEKHWQLVRDNKLPPIRKKIEDELSSTFNRDRMRDILSVSVNIWFHIRNSVGTASDEAARKLTDAVANFDLDALKLTGMVDDFKKSAREMFERNLREELQDMNFLRQRFITAFSSERSVGGSTEATQDGYRKFVKFLSTMAVMRWDEREGDEREDNVESLLVSALIDQVLPDPLAADAWEGVPPEMTLITPERCRFIWNQLQPEMQTTHAAAIVIVEESGTSKHWPIWVIMGILVLGGGVVAILRFTNADMLLALGHALTGIEYAELTLQAAEAVVPVGIAWQSVNLARDGPAHRAVVRLWRNHRGILKVLKEALRRLAKLFKSFLERKNSSVVVAVVPA